MFSVDWLSVYQDHAPGSLPVVGACIVLYTDPESGRVERQVVHGLCLEGSHSTTLRIRSDGTRVEVSGNPSRYGRPDNVWGFGSVEAALGLYNRLLVECGLPPFSVDERGSLLPYQYQRGRGVVWHGAKVTRVDLCVNYEAGSAEQARRVIRALSTVSHRGGGAGVFPDGNGVAWGAGSRYFYRKYYLKGPEMASRRSRKDRSPYRSQVQEWCQSRGVVRFEVSLKAMWIASNGLSCPTSWTVPRCEAIVEAMQLHGRSEATMHSWDHIADELEALGVPRTRAVHAQHRALAYLGGADLRAELSRATYYRTRKDLLRVGIDIAAPLDISSLRFQVEVVELREAQPPEWYILCA